jgi:hypothetical protein
MLIRSHCFDDLGYFSMSILLKIRQRGMACADIRAQVLMLRAAIALRPTYHTLIWMFEEMDFSIDSKTPRSVFSFMNASSVEREEKSSSVLEFEHWSS